MVDPSKVQIDVSWKKVLWKEFESAYFDRIKINLTEDKNKGKTIYPPGPLIFNAFNLTPFEKVKVVIIGQDPYHGPGEAMGLCFSVPKSIRIPPSLRNIFKELVDDCGISMPEHGDLTAWAKQGVFLLNAMLTVQHKSPGSHKNIGWQQFTDGVIRLLSEHKKGIIFLLWGKFAQGKRELIDEMKHHVLEAAHPSPLARNAYMGSAHFSKTNEILKSAGQDTIDWQIH
ncbi:MAG: uracil-DNA glycosylase [Bacteroidia bacterium]|nr:uracil-DNA glycosylase [Bacteroidia bacterium]